MKTKLSGPTFSTIRDSTREPPLPRASATHSRSTVSYLLTSAPLEGQRDRRHKGLASLTPPIEKYRFMRDLQDTNETLFYSLITHHVEEILPIVYMPTVGEACQKFSEICVSRGGSF